MVVIISVPNPAFMKINTYGTIDILSIIPDNDIRAVNNFSEGGIGSPFDTQDCYWLTVMLYIFR